MPNYPALLDTRKLEAVEYDAAKRELRVRFDDGCMAAVSTDSFKVFSDAPVERVTMGQPPYWVEFHFADGEMIDVAAGFITWLTHEDYARAYPEDTELGPIIAGNVARLRKSRGLSQVALAAASDMKAPNVNRLESGKQVPTLDVLLRVARALGVRLSDLMMGARADGVVVPAVKRQPKKPTRRAPAAKAKTTRRKGTALR